MARRNRPNRSKSTRHRDPQANYRRAVDRSRLARSTSSGVSLKAATPGVVVWAVIPFTDNPSDGKYRPAVVLRATGPHSLLVMPLYTRRDRFDEVPLVDWDGAGMSRPVAWFPTKLVEIARSECSHIVGKVAEEDLEAMVEAVGAHLHLVR